MRRLASLRMEDNLKWNTLMSEQLPHWNLSKIFLSFLWVNLIKFIGNGFGHKLRKFSNAEMLGALKVSLEFMCTLKSLSVN